MHTKDQKRLGAISRWTHAADSTEHAIRDYDNQIRYMHGIKDAAAIKRVEARRSIEIGRLEYYRKMITNTKAALGR